MTDLNFWQLHMMIIMILSFWLKFKRKVNTNANAARSGCTGWRVRSFRLLLPSALITRLDEKESAFLWKCAHFISDVEVTKEAKMACNGDSKAAETLLQEVYDKIRTAHKKTRVRCDDMKLHCDTAWEKHLL